MTKKRNRRAIFHLSGDSIVQPHPQAKSEFAKRQGYIVLKFQPGLARDFKQSIVDMLNLASIGAMAVWEHDRSYRE